jgi:hypothetical protein
MVHNNRCTRCLYRGHQKNGRCKWVQANLATFENSAKHGYVTGNRDRDQARANKANSAVQKQAYSRRTQHQVARIRILPQRVTLAESERLAKVGNTMQTYIFNRVELLQSSYEDFPLATGLMFDTYK